jgi:alcohol oxidase
MFHFLEYPFSRGSTMITSPSAYDAPDFDAGFMNDKRDMAPMGKLDSSAVICQPY